MDFIQPENQVWSTISQESCLCASDGSAPQNQGAFVWVIRNQRGQQSARCSGPAFGHNILSYQAKSYGILSLLSFLHTMNQIYVDPPRHSQKSHSIFCDNEGLVTTVNKVSTYKNIYPNTTVTPEWDMIAQIRYTLHALGPQQPHIVRIAGHQDTHTPYKELPLPAHSTVTLRLLQLNTWPRTHVHVWTTAMHPCYHRPNALSIYLKGPSPGTLNRSRAIHVMTELFNDKCAPRMGGTLRTSHPSIGLHMLKH